MPGSCRVIQKNDGLPVTNLVILKLCCSLSGSIVPVDLSVVVEMLKLLIIVFSCRKVDNSNCDFTFRFTIKIVGIQPGSINPSLIIVLVSFDY